MPTIGLSMIVKNEAEVILRCLESVRRLVDYVLIADTGSSDGTQGIIRSYLEQTQLPGEVIEEPWRDFASNRTSALRALRARNAVDYALIIDADETIEYTADFDPTAFKASLTLDLYHVEIELGDVLYWRPQLLSTRREFSYRGVLHEFVDAPTDAGSGNAAGLRMMSGREQGARKRNPDTYQHDARVLEQALALEQDPFLRSRYIFYLAQSYRDSGDRERALAAYLARSTMGFWDEEVFVSLIYAARLMQDLGRSNDEVLSLYNRASTLCPGRAEALHGASKLLQALGRHEEAYEVAKRGAAIEMPGHGLFLERTVYAHDMQEQLALSAYWSERPAEALRIWLGLLADGRLPANEHARIARNGQFALDKLPAERNLGAPGRESLRGAASTCSTPPASPGRCDAERFARDPCQTDGSGVAALPRLHRGIGLSEVGDIAPHPHEQQHRRHRAAVATVRRPPRPALRACRVRRDRRAGACAGLWHTRLER